MSKWDNPYKVNAYRSVAACHRLLHDGKLTVEIISTSTDNVEIKFWRKDR